MSPNPESNSTNPKAASSNTPPLSTLIVRTLFIILTNLVALNGVVRLGWNAVPLVLIFILESFLILGTDFVKHRVDRDNQSGRGLIVFETAFILFYGFFAALVFGPYETLEDALTDGFRLQREMIAGELRNSLAALVFLRLVQLGKDLFGAGIFGGPVRRRLQLEGGGRSFLLFAAVMLAPLIARTGPNPTGGLMALVVLKTLGEVFAVWAARIGGGKSRGRTGKDKRQRSVSMKTF